MFPPSHIIGGGAVHVHICFYKTGIKPADCQILFYHTTRGLDFLKTLYLSNFYFKNRKGNNMSKSL